MKNISGVKMYDTYYDRHQNFDLDVDYIKIDNDYNAELFARYIEKSHKDEIFPWKAIGFPRAGHYIRNVYGRREWVYESQIKKYPCGLQADLNNFIEMVKSLNLYK